MAEIQMAKGVLLIDDEDVHLLRGLQPLVNGTGYAAVGHYPDETLVHRMVMGAGKGEHTDHQNLNKLDCRKSNLRIATFTQNMWNRPKYANNRSGLKGVSICVRTGRWRAHITTHRKQHFLGRFDTVEEAGAAYDQACVELHGAFARPNSIQPTA